MPTSLVTAALQGNTAGHPAQKTGSHQSQKDFRRG